MPGAPSSPQSGTPSVPHAPAGAQSGALGAQSGAASSPGSAAIQTAGTSAARNLGGKLLATAAGKVIASILVVAVLGAGISAATGPNPLTLLSRGSSTGGTGSPNATATPPPPPPEITYLGSDDNIWDMQLPNSTPRQWTTDAQPQGIPSSGITYSGLAWSPDGIRLAVLRSDLSNSASELLLFSPDGKIGMRVPLAGTPGNRPFVWSPDGRMIAYRIRSNGASPQARLILLDAHTGAVVKQFSYGLGGSACDAGPNALEYTIAVAEDAFFVIDTFAWSPDQHSLLVWYDCGLPTSERVDLNSGATTLNYPVDATYQPESNLILGQWNTAPDASGMNVLGLSGAAGNHVRMLMTDPSQGSQLLYEDALGEANWTSNGQAIYYEYEDGIWRINADGSGAHRVAAGTTLDSQGNATVEILPRPSPDGRMLLYLQLQGNTNSGNLPTGQWYVAQADGANPMPLAQVTLGSAFAQPIDAVWRPGT